MGNDGKGRGREENLFKVGEGNLGKKRDGAAYLHI